MPIVATKSIRRPNLISYIVLLPIYLVLFAIGMFLLIHVALAYFNYASFGNSAAKYSGTAKEKIFENNGFFESTYKIAITSDDNSIRLISARCHCSLEYGKKVNVLYRQDNYVIENGYDGMKIWLIPGFIFTFTALLGFYNLVFRKVLSISRSIVWYSSNKE